MIFSQCGLQANWEISNFVDFDNRFRATIMFTYEMSSVFLSRYRSFQRTPFSVEQRTRCPKTLQRRLQKRANTCISLRATPQVQKGFHALKERHCAFYEQTQLKKDSSRTNDTSKFNSAYSNAAAHMNLLTKYKPRSNSHNETTLEIQFKAIPKRSTIRHHLYNPGVPKLKEKLVFDHQQREPCTNFSKCSHGRLQDGKITQRPFGQS